MPDLWRISNYRTLTGEGGLRFGARWHSAGRRIVYLAESPPGAMIEVLVHLEIGPDDLPPGYTLLRVSVPEELTMEALPVPLEMDWRTNLAMTRGLGDAWLRRNETALARVPSAIMPATSNYLLNPSHVDASGLQVMQATAAEFDPRLLKAAVQESI